MVSGTPHFRDYFAEDPAFAEVLASTLSEGERKTMQRKTLQNRRIAQLCSETPTFSEV